MQTTQDWRPDTSDLIVSLSYIKHNAIWKTLRGVVESQIPDGPVYSLAPKWVIDTSEQWNQCKRVLTQRYSNDTNSASPPSRSHSFVYCCHGLCKTLPSNRRSPWGELWGQRRVIMMWITPPSANKNQAEMNPRGTDPFTRAVNVWSRVPFYITGLTAVSQWR